MALILPLGIDARGAAVGAKGFTAATDTVSAGATKATKAVVTLDKSTAHLGVTSTKTSRVVQTSTAVMGTAFNGVGLAASNAGKTLATVSGIATASVVPGMTAMATTGAAVATSFNGIGLSAVRAGTAVEASMVKATAATSAMNFVMRNFLSIMAGVAVVRAMVSTIADFELTLTKVKGVTNASAEEMENLISVARELGATTIFSAKEAGEGLLFLARAGFSVAESIEALPATLNLAAAGSFELGEAADLASNVLRQFNLETSETTRVVDALLRVTNQANTDIKQLGEAMKFAGPIAGALGKTVEETAVLIGLLGDAGIQASLAGTNLRGVMLALTAPTDGARMAIEELGLSVLDLDPTMNSMQSIFAAFSAAGLKAGQAAQIFGRRNTSAALILTRAQASIDANVAALESMNSAQTIAEQNAKTLAGEFKALRSAVQELFLATGDKFLAGSLKTLVIFFTDVFRVLSGMETAIRSNEVAVRAMALVIEFLTFRLAALILLNVGKMFLDLALAIKAATISMKALNVAFKANPVGLLATAAALAITAFIALRSEMTEIKTLAEEIKDEFKDMTKDPLRNLTTFGDDFAGKIKTAEEGIKRLTKMLQLMRAEGPEEAVLGAMGDLNTVIDRNEFARRIRASTGQPFEGGESILGREEASGIIARQMAILRFGKKRDELARDRQKRIDEGTGFEGTIQRIKDQTKELDKQAKALSEVEAQFKKISIDKELLSSLSRAGIDPRLISEEDRDARAQEIIGRPGVSPEKTLSDLVALDKLFLKNRSNAIKLRGEVEKLVSASEVLTETQTTLALQEYSADLDFQIRTMRMSTDEVERAIVQQEAFNKVIELSGSGATDAASKFAAAQVDKIIRLQEADKAKASREAAENKELALRQQTLGSIANALSDIAVEGRKASDVIRDLAKQLSGMFLRNAFMSFFTGGGQPSPGGAPGGGTGPTTPTTSPTPILPSTLAPEFAGQGTAPANGANVTVNQTFIDKARDVDSFKRNNRSIERDVRDRLNS